MVNPPANPCFPPPLSAWREMLSEIRLHESLKACRLEFWQGRPRLFRHCGNQPMHTSLHPVVFSGDTMTDVDRAYNIVRKELAEVGLLAEGKYLDQIELWISDRPSEGESAYIFEAPGPWESKQSSASFAEAKSVTCTRFSCSITAPGGRSSRNGDVSATSVITRPSTRESMRAARSGRRPTRWSRR